MPKLIRYCEGVMEAVWLAAIVCIPLFLNIHGETVESEKNYLLRSLAIVLLAAWSLSKICQAGFRESAKILVLFPGRTLLKTPLTGPALLLGLLLVISTILSLSPWVSFWGVTARRLGSYSYLSCLLFFAAMLLNIRSHQQLNRVITLAILTSLPVSLYAIGQRYSIEPILWTSSMLPRAGATFAHAVYLGAYLIMIVPLTASRILVHCLAFRSRIEHRASHLPQIFVYGLAAILQVWAIVVTVSRGPIIGLITGLSIMFLMLSVYWRKRWLVLAPMGTVILLLAGFAFVSWTDGPLRQLSKRYEVQRFSEMLNPKLGSAGERAAVWRVAAQAFLSPKIAEMGEGRQDPFPRARFWFGYGLENVGPVSRLHALREFNAALPNHTLFDRFHNDFWDTLLTTGTLGLAAYLALTFQIAYYACKWLGFVASSRQRVFFWWFWGGGGLIGSLGLVFWQGIGFLGLGLRLGTSIGLMTFLVWIALWKKLDPATHGALTERTLILIALLSALVGHLIEVGFSFVFETTLLHFWIYTALLFVVGQRWTATKSATISTDATTVNAPSVPADNSSPAWAALRTESVSISPAHEPKVFDSVWSSWCSWRAEIIGGIAIALIWTTLGVMLIQKSTAHSALQTIVDALTRLPGTSNAFTWVLLVSTVSIWLLSAVMWTNEFRPAIPSRPWWWSFTTTLVVSGALAFVYWYALARHTALMSIIPGDSLDSLGRYLDNRFYFVSFYYGSTLLLILLMAPFLPERRANRPAHSSRYSGFARGFGCVLAGAAFAAIYAANLRWSKVGMMATIAKEEYFQREANQWMPVALHETAIKTVPASENHYLALGKVLIEQAAGKTSVEAQQALYAKADLVLEAGSRLRPLDPAFLSRRGNLYLKWALSEPAGEKRVSFGKTAVDLYQKALVLDPGDFTMWLNLAYVQIAVARSFAEAHRSLTRSLELFPNHHPAYGLLGDLFFQKGLAAPEPLEKKVFLNSAATNYQQAAALTDPGTAYRYNVGLGRTYVSLGELAPAIAAYKTALNSSPPTDVWRNEEVLARLYSDSKNQTNSLHHWQRAFDQAPEDKRADLLKLKAEILARP